MTTTPDGRTPHTDEPAEGAEAPGGQPDETREAHPEEPAEGPDDPAVTGG